MKPTAACINKALILMQELFDMGLYDALFIERTDVGRVPMWNEWIRENEARLDRFHVNFFCGLTKGCIVPEDIPWVIKVGFIQDINYCRRECEFYKEACKEHLERYFAAEYRIGAIHGVDIYLQEKVTPDEKRISFDLREHIMNVYNIECCSEEELEEAIQDGIDCSDVEDIYYAVTGEKIEDELLYFLDENNIDDLHTGNWGFTEDGRVVIFDYSGYNV